MSNLSEGYYCETCGLSILDDCTCVELETCPKGHGQQVVISASLYPGFCAGYVHVTTLACGDQIVNDASYLEK